MIFYSDFFTSSVYLYAYMLVYNLSLILVFWILSTVFIASNKTLNSFSGFNLHSSSLLFLSVSFFSIAGVPPFTGFLTKLFLLNLLINQKLAYLYFLLFILLFIGLYFYVQNMRFLHASDYTSHLAAKFLNQKLVSLSYVYYAVIVTFFLFFGVFYLDDFLLVCLWLFS
jgi:NADH-quinone oxidoreductase subunit N